MSGLSPPSAEKRTLEHAQLEIPTGRQRTNGISLNVQSVPAALIIAPVGAIDRAHIPFPGTVFRTMLITSGHVEGVSRRRHEIE